MPPCRRCFVTAILVALCCMLAAPIGAVAQQSPFQGLPPATPEETQTQTTNNIATTTDSGLETWQGALIVAGGLALLTGIGLAIARDARERAPVDLSETSSEQRGADAHKHARQAKIRQRQKQKAARASRRKNR